MKDVSAVSASILRRQAVERRTGIPRSSLYKMIKAGDFPSPIRLSTRSVGWLESEVNAFIEARIGRARRSITLQGAL